MTQLESLTVPTQVYKFSLGIYGCGGEHTIGTVTNEIAAYWQTDGEEFFHEYMFSWNKPEISKKYNIPEKFQLQDWNELDDLSHFNGPEIEENSTSVEVLAYESNNTISEIILTKEMIEIEQEPEISDELKKDVKCVYGQAFNKGNFIYGPIESDKPFDSKKLIMNCSAWDGLLILNYIEYDGEGYYLEEENTTGKSQNISFS